MFDISIWITSISAFLTAILGLVALIKGPDAKVNRTFFFLTLSMAIWQLSNFFENEDISLRLATIFLKIDFASAVFIGYYWLAFVSNFSQGKHIIVRPFKKIIIFLSALFLFIISFTDLVASNIHVNNGTLFFDMGRLWFVYAIGVAIFFVTGYIKIILNLFKSHGQERIQTLYIFVGFSVSSGIALVINLLLNRYLSASQSRIGIYGILIFVVCSFYAIIKHHLFNIKIIATELFTLAICTMLLIRSFLSGNFVDLVTNFTIFISTVIFGILLVRSVIQEVSQKEKMEKMAKEIEQAYELQKKANQELEALDMVKNQFLMTIQHHLRTPLTSMRGYADLLLVGTFGKVPKKIEQVVKKFEGSTVVLIKMVNDFLDITQFQLGKDVVSLKEEVNLSLMIEEIMKDIEFEVNNKKLYLKFEKADLDCIIKADGLKLKAALVNILDNAVKYTNEGGITIELKAGGQKAKIIIKDTGMGIAKERLPELFDSTFKRTEEAKKTFVSGRGIGLYLSGQIVKAHNGKIWAESDGEGKGSAFHIELPLK